MRFLQMILWNPFVAIGESIRKMAYEDSNPGMGIVALVVMLVCLVPMTLFLGIEWLHKVVRGGFR